MSIENTTVRTLIDRPTVDVDPDATLRQVAETLAGDYIGVAVVRGAPPSRGPGTHAAGLISERDIVRALAEGADPDEEIAQNVMTLDLVSLPPGATLRGGRRMHGRQRNPARARHRRRCGRRCCVGTRPCCVHCWMSGKPDDLGHLLR